LTPNVSKPEKKPVKEALKKMDNKKEETSEINGIPPKPQIVKITELRSA
jgi:hypothetical protein